MAKKITRSRQFKNCGGCGDPFLTYKNYDYCANCALNNSRYVSRPNQCPECGDGSGWVKFPSQPKRKCKLCFLSQKTMSKNNQERSPGYFDKYPEKFWDQVDQLAQEKIYHLLTSNIPLPNLKLIPEAYQFTDQQNELTGLFLGKDADYRTLLADIENQYATVEGKLPTAEQLAEEIAINYFYLVFKALLTDLSNYYGFDPSYFSLENLFKD